MAAGRLGSCIAIGAQLIAMISRRHDHERGPSCIYPPAGALP
jgi:hypothetical protein